MLICVCGDNNNKQVRKRLKNLGYPPLLNHAWKLFSTAQLEFTETVKLTNRQKVFETKKIKFYLKTNNYIGLTC